MSNIADRETAAGLGDGIEVELRRLRDTAVDNGQIGGLDRLASLIPASDDPGSLRLVASRDGSQLLFESVADAPDGGLAPRDRYFLIEVRQQPGSLTYSTGTGFLAASADVRWPYRPGASSLQPYSSLVIGLAFAP